MIQPCLDDTLASFREVFDTDCIKATPSTTRTSYIWILFPGICSPTQVLVSLARRPLGDIEVGHRATSGWYIPYTVRAYLMEQNELRDERSNGRPLKHDLR